MDLHSGLPYWPMLHGILTSYPSLSTDTDCEVAILGAGITGAMVAWHLSQAGYDVLVVDRRHVGMGSTAASTALLQYELDISLYDLSKMIGNQAAEKAYLVCENAVLELGDLCCRLGVGSYYNQTGSFQFASFQKDIAALKQEFQCRKNVGFNVEWLESTDIKNKYGIGKSVGIFSETGAGLDAYALTHRLMEDGIRKEKLRVFDHTEIEEVEYRKKGVILHTKSNHKIKAGRLVFACGYESEQFLPFKVQQLHSTYAIISEPIPQQEFWYRNSLIWETAKPYLYVRVTDDYRIAVGGKDTNGSDPSRRYRQLPAKTRQLENAFKKLFPLISFTTDFAWAGSFASTKDGLPFIGKVVQCPNSYFVMGLGGNGIPFSMVAADLVKSWLQNKSNSNSSLFCFDR